MEKIKFCLFADLHYKKGMYVPTVTDLEKIFERAKESDSMFVLHAGDFCNDYKGSPELVQAYLNNSYGLPVYGVYGNHELESADNGMANVTPCLTNREVVWGTPDGKIGDGSIAYYYFDVDNFRFVCLDTNYSKNPITEEWEHNASVSHGPPKGNLLGNSMGPVQLQWLEDLLVRSAEEKKKCVVIGHCGFSGLWWSNPEAEAVRAIYAKVNAIEEGTVLFSINGHLHTDRQGVVDDVVYMDVNTVRNNLWVPNDKAVEHYGAMTYPFVDYDADGNEISRRDRLISEIRMAKNTWFNADPISAIVTVWEDGRMEIEGTESRWLYDIPPCVPHNGDFIAPRVSSGSYAPLAERKKRAATD